MVSRGLGQFIMVLFLIVVLLHVQVRAPLVDESTIPVSTHNEMLLSQLLARNMISIDTLAVGSDYLNIEEWSLATCNDYLYMVNSYMTQDYHGKMIIIDISDPTNLVKIGEVSGLGACSQVSVFDNRAYVADYTNGLWIFNVSDPSDVSVLGQFSDYNYILGAYIDQQIAYIETHGYGLRIVNVSDPANLIEIGSYAVPGDTGSYPVHVQDDYAYIAHRDGLDILNVSDPSNPFLVGSVDSYGFKKQILMRDALVFVPTGARLMIFDVSDPTNPVEFVDPIEIGYSPCIEIEGTLLFATSDFRGLQVFDISSYRLTSAVGLFQTDGEGRAVLSKDGYLYLVNHHSGLWCLEHDCDEDELYSRSEYEAGTFPDNPDTDSDLMPDGWEVQYSLNPLIDDSHLDPDMDDLENLLEYELGTSPILADSDDDEYSDSWEYYNGFDPLDPRVGLQQYFVSILGWLGLGVILMMGTITTLWVLKRYISPEKYEEYPYDGTSSRLTR